MNDAVNNGQKNWRLDKATNEKGTKAKFYRGYLAVCHAKNG